VREIAAVGEDPDEIGHGKKKKDRLAAVSREVLERAFCPLFTV